MQVVHSGPRIAPALFPVEDKNLSKELYSKIIEIISDRKKLEGMRKNMQELAVVDAEQSIANLLLETSQNTQRKGGR